MNASFKAAVQLFNEARFLAAHELFDELWEQGQGEDSDFYKGLVQASVCLHHFEEGNLEGAAKLYRGHRRSLAGYLPSHAGLDVSGFLRDMKDFLEPVLRRAPEACYDPGKRPHIALTGKS